jgi:hypothetical protein
MPVYLGKGLSYAELADLNRAFLPAVEAGTLRHLPPISMSIEDTIQPVFFG